MLDKRYLLTFLLQSAVIVFTLIFLGGFQWTKNNVLSIAQHPHPILRQKAKAIDQIDESILTLVEDIIATLRYRTLRDFFTRRTIPKGLAAPQVGIPKKLIVCGLNGKARVLINPVILERKGTYTSQEGCLSVNKGEIRTVKRAAYLKLKYTGLDDRERLLVVKDEDAAMLEHEIDHLHGVLNIDRTDEEYEIL